MAQPNHTPRLAETEEALTVLFCLIDDAYAHLNPRARCYESIKRLSDSEVIALALFQQLRGVESERSFLRDAQRFFCHLFPGVVGFLQRLRGEAAPHLRHQWGPSLLRAHPCQRRRRLLDRGAPRRGGFGGWSSEEALGGPGLPKRGVEGGLGRNGHRSCYRALRAAPRSEATRRDCLVEPQEGVRTGRDACDHAGGACHEDRGQDEGLHSRFSRKPGVGSSSRQDQGSLGINLTTHI